LPDLAGEHAEAAYVRLCEFNPDSCLRLAAFFAGRGRDAEAARAFERALAEAGNRVAVSNNAPWLVDYYVEQGRPERAGEVARALAQVYSGTGLAALAALEERSGRHEEAERVYQQIATRYPRTTDLDAFYVRSDLKGLGARFPGKAAPARSRLFPEGLVLTRLSDYPRVRESSGGVRITASSPKFEKLGLAEDDVIVAINGYRVTNLVQYKCLRSLKDEGDVSVIVWHRDGSRAEEMKAPLRGPNPALFLADSGR
jgi:tetratricopeptide (TPR) repeat protein